LIHRASVPSAIDSPIWGMITSILAIDVLPPESPVLSCQSLVAPMWLVMEQR
jgi:hypothetical protein